MGKSSMSRGSIISVLGGLVLLASTLGGCTSAVENTVKEASPRLQSVNLSLTSLTPTDANIEVKTSMENVNTSAASIENLSYQLFYWDKSQWQMLAQGSAPGAEIKPNGSLEMAIPTKVKAQAAFGALWRLVANEGSIRLKLTGSAEAKVGPARFNVPIGQEFTLSFSMPSPVPSSPLPSSPGLPGR